MNTILVTINYKDENTILRMKSMVENGMLMGKSNQKYSSDK